MKLWKIVLPIVIVLTLVAGLTYALTVQWTPPFTEGPGMYIKAVVLDVVPSNYVVLNESSILYLLRAVENQTEWIRVPYPYDKAVLDMQTQNVRYNGTFYFVRIVFVDSVGK